MKLIEDNEFQTIWAWVGFAIGLGIMLTALIRVRFRWETRHKPERPAPKALPEAGSPPAGPP